MKHLLGSRKSQGKAIVAEKKKKEKKEKKKKKKGKAIVAAVQVERC